MHGAIVVDQVFAALADNSRRHLLEQLAAQGPQSASKLARTATISRQAITKHLAVLEEAGLVSRLRSGREVVYAVEAHQLGATGRWLQRMAQRWELSPAASTTSVSV